MGPWFFVVGQSSIKQTKILFFYFSVVLSTLWLADTICADLETVICRKLCLLYHAICFHDTTHTMQSDNTSHHIDYHSGSCNNFPYKNQDMVSCTSSILVISSSR
ncbi:hypothetical protein pBo15 [Bovine gammaherpesvirus 4]|uniref:Secreted protein n=2 Tax=Bovine herpesvirus 4 TaxID=10385 RepID=A0A858PWR3_BHV4|nr:hypothetical protein pBo15 [Bovine gammaherpesvirus 4]AAK07997.1 hypothetical protein pBo15 [Bovine gammaherpesvirus 4]QJC19136.1 putative protein pBo15 [Bovine gammaherpesvirus 4]